MKNSSKKKNLRLAARLVVFVGMLTVAVLYWESSRPKTPIDWSQVGPEISESSPMDVIGFSLSDQNGKQVSLENFKGRPILLNFWAAWCPPCVEELPSLLKFADWARKNIGLEVVAVSADPKASDVRELFEKKKLWSYNDVPFTLLLNPDGKVAERYKSTKFPETYFINREFKIVRKFVGPQDWASEETVKWIVDHSK